jgi:SpoVK/Ycf46/Vps4 family AAA+-type ATPase
VDSASSLRDKAIRMLDDSIYLSRIETNQTLDQLILVPHTRDLIVSVLQSLKDPRRESFASWGLVAASLTNDPDVQRGCNILLHGVPGTGKTFIAGVMANELQRPLIQINASSIRMMYFGATEKRATELFEQMRFLARHLAPVFLLNEGDQLIHRRMETPSHGTDTAENALQSVFLEEMESFPGIIVVTSNLQSSLDEAMSRRFHFKLEIPAPDAEARMALWRLHLPGSIPGARDIAIEDLARDFSFTGGQIRLVVQNACHEAYLRGPDARLSLEDLRRYAALECGSSFEGRMKVIGFGV